MGLSSYDSEHCLLFGLILLSVFLPSNSFLFPFGRSIAALQCPFVPAIQQNESAICVHISGFPGSSVGKESSCNAGDTGEVGSIPGLRWSPGGGYGNPLWCSGLENPMERGAWWASVQRSIHASRPSQHWAELPVLYGRFPLAIYFTHGSVYIFGHDWVTELNWAECIYISVTLPIHLTLPCPESTCPFSISMFLSPLILWWMTLNWILPATLTSQNPQHNVLGKGQSHGFIN